MTAAGAGTLRSGDTVRAGAAVTAGDILGYVVGQHGQRPVAAAYDTVIAKWLVRDGDPVSEGKPLVRLEPKEQAQ